jgi:hypothetical protein
MSAINPVAQIGDVIRGSLLADRPEQIPLLLQSVTERVIAQGGKFFIKNFWEDPKPLSLGYVGVHIKIRMPLPSKETNASEGQTPSSLDNQKKKYILMELQLHVKEIMDGTKDCAKEIAHLLYKTPQEADEKISSEIIGSSQLVYLAAMTKLLASKEDLKRVNDTVKIFQAMTKADKKMRLVMETAMLLHNEKLEGEWSERLQVVVPKDKEAVATAWMATAQKINTILNLPKLKMEGEDWTNTATSVDEIYDNAKQIAPFFSEMCKQAAASFPRCSVNFGPENRHMIKEKSSLIGKIKSDLGENCLPVVFHAPLTKERTASMIQILSDYYAKYHRAGSNTFSFMGKPFAKPRSVNKESIACLQQLHLSAKWITDIDLTLLGDLVPMLNGLTISNNQITGSGLASLSNLPNLKQLCLSECDALTDSDLANLSHLKELTILSIDKCNHITGSSLASLNSLKNLSILTLSECNQITYSNLSNLSGLITAKCSIHINKCKNIRNSKLTELSGLTDVQCRKIGVTDPSYEVTDSNYEVTDSEEEDEFFK